MSPDVVHLIIKALFSLFNCTREKSWMSFEKIKILIHTRTSGRSAPLVLVPVPLSLRSVTNIEECD